MSKPLQKPTALELGGVPLDPMADLLLPTLLLVGLSAGAAALITVGRDVMGLLTLPFPWLICFLFAAESYLFTTAFQVRSFDPPVLLGWVELAGALAVAKFLAALPVVGLAEALTGGMDSFSVLIMIGFYMGCWGLGRRLAHQLWTLHPYAGRVVQEADIQKTDEHGAAFGRLVHLLGWLIALVAAALSLVDWLTGRAGLWGWNGSGVLLLIFAVSSAAALAIAALQKQRITWAQEGLTPPDAVMRRWVPAATALAALPLLAAILLPAGWARLPWELLLGLFQGGESGERRAIEMVDHSSKLFESNQRLLAALHEGQAEGGPWWLGMLMMVVGGLVALVLLGALVTLIHSRLKYDLASGASGWRRLVAFLFAWQQAIVTLLKEAFSGALQQLRKLPAQAAERLFNETSLLGGLVPDALRRVPADPREAVRHFYRRLVTEAERRGLRRAPGTTAVEFAAALKAAAPHQAETVARVTEAYETARYDRAQVAPEQVGFVRRAWVAVARSLRKR